MSGKDFDNSGSVTRFFSQLRTGDPESSESLWNRFFPRLQALAHKTPTGRPQQLADAEDAALSAFATFVRRARDGEFEAIQNRDDL